MRGSPWPWEAFGRFEVRTERDQRGPNGRRRAAMVILVALDGRLLVHHRNDHPRILYLGCWAGFGGAVDLGERAEAATQR